MTEFWHSRFNNINKVLKITVDVSECVLSDTEIHGQLGNVNCLGKVVKENTEMMLF